MKKILVNVDHIQTRFFNEWLVTNGIGGFACGTICGVPTRKYHSLLNAALPSPYGRTVMLNYVQDTIRSSKHTFSLSNIHKYGEENIVSSSFLIHFRIENGIPYWTFNCNGILIEKSLFFIHRQNTVCLSYKVLEATENVILEWRPYFHFRAYEQPVNIQIPDEAYAVSANGHEYEISCPHFPQLRIANESAPAFTMDLHKLHGIYHKTEAERGYESVGNLTSPGYFSISLAPDQRTSFLISTESWDTMHVLSAKNAYRIESLRKRNLLKSASLANKFPVISKLVLAADQFIITPYTRYQDMIRLQAAGEEIRSVIAGFPWFTDWGRDTMISLEGLTLVTGRSRDAYAILHTFAQYVKEGLIPNMFPDGETKGIYNTADASLWFFHAIDRYIEYTKDEEILEFLLPALHEIIEKHIRGTLFGIHVDTDGLLIQGQDGFQLTWMDAKVGDWVVTPRRGKAVEINALWYNALKLYESWTGKTLECTAQCYESFNQKFWNKTDKCLFDVVDGENGPHDPAIRPNQLFAISLKYPVLQHDRWSAVLEVCCRDLLTPVGLRTLSPIHPEYKTYYDGDLHARDAAYHQGTVWPWLLGPFIDVWLKVYPEDYAGAYQILKGLEERFDENSMGSLGEIFDATGPYKDRGCFAQAWSVAELLRCLVKILPHV